MVRMPGPSSVDIRWMLRTVALRSDPSVERARPSDASVEAAAASDPFVEATVASIQDPTMDNDIVAFYISPLCIAGSVMMNLLELLVAGLQAYIYTFLSAMFLGLYVEPAH